MGDAVDKAKRPVAMVPDMVLAILDGAGSWDANPWVWVTEFRRLGSEAGNV